jgi:cyclophilin family peptidyl-prolyl cis-trans isomerase
MKKNLILICLTFVFMLSGSHLNAKTTGNTSTLPQPGKTNYVVITTQFGEIKIKLYNETPLHRDNFIKLAKEGYFDNTLFHRVIPQFMIQGGDPGSKEAKPGEQLGNGGPGYTLPAEFRPALYHKRGALAAARESDQVNPEKRSSGSQFYIVQGRVFKNEDLAVMEQRMNESGRVEAIRAFLSNPKNIQYKNKVDSLQKAQNMEALNTVIQEIEVKIKPEIDKKPKLSFSPEQKKDYTTIGGAPHLDGAYTVFGEVVSGMDIVDKIAAAERDKSDRPLKDISMTVKVISE